MRKLVSCMFACAILCPLLDQCEMKMPEVAASRKRNQWNLRPLIHNVWFGFDHSLSTKATLHHLDWWWIQKPTETSNSQHFGRQTFKEKRSIIHRHSSEARLKETPTFVWSPWHLNFCLGFFKNMEAANKQQLSAVILFLHQTTEGCFLCTDVRRPQERWRDGET